MAGLASGEIDKLKTRSGLEHYVNQNRHLCIGMSDDYNEASIRLKLLATNYMKSRMGYMEGIYKINRMVRPLKHTADLLEDAAKSFGVLMKLYNGLFVPQTFTNTVDVLEPDK
ncbi:MAG TPA: hypothetical protein VLT90_12990 [Terriglobales bacterium]|nr:hypothetical protein [Terriglobales bacterium]